MMNIVGNLLMSVVSNNLSDKLQDHLYRAKIKRLTAKLKRRAGRDAIKSHKHGDYYDSLDAYISGNDIVSWLIVNCRDKTHEFMDSDEFAKEHAKILIGQNSAGINYQNTLIGIFKNLYEVIDGAIEESLPDVERIYNRMAESEHRLGTKIDAKYNAETPTNIPHLLTERPPVVGKEFCHRNETIADLRKSLSLKQGRKLALISGFGGIGKTTIARALYHEVKRDFKHIAWVEYQGNLRESLLGSFKLYEEHKEPKDDETRYSEIKRFLDNATEDTLIFIENLSDDADIGFMGSLGANVIVTSRMEELHAFDSVAVDFLTKEQCEDIFYRYYKYEKFDKEKKYSDVVSRLVELVSCHTLSVELLAKAANIAGYPLDEYEDDLKAKGFGYPKLRFKTGHYSEDTLTIAEHLVKLFELVGFSAEQERILKNFSILPSFEIPAEVEKWLACDINDLKRLIEKGWLVESKNGYRMHDVIKTAISLQGGAQYESCMALVEYMSSEEYVKDMDIYSYLLLYVAKGVMEYFYDVESPQIASVCCNIAYAYSGHLSCYYEDALEWYRKAVSIREKTLGVDHPDTARTYNNIAGIYYIQGFYKVALEWCQRDLGIADETDIATSYSNIAGMYCLRNCYKLALECYQEAFYIWFRVLGESHPYTMLVIGNMRYAYTGLYGEDADFIAWLKKQIDALAD